MKLNVKIGTYGLLGKINNKGWSVWVPTSFGESIKHFKNVDSLIEFLFEFDQKKQKIGDQKKAIDNYCTNNKWTRSGS